MKLKLTLSILISIIVSYMVFGFVLAEANPFNWDWPTRGMALCLTGIFVVQIARCDYLIKEKKQ